MKICAKITRIKENKLTSQGLIKPPVTIPAERDAPSHIRERINKFGNHCGINWRFTPHQFRRTFAVYAAHSALGDLRYLRQHFKHWSLDMTALYALNEEQDTELYDDIMMTLKNEKIAIVEHWLDEDALVIGGMAEQIISFRKNSEPVRTYSSRRNFGRTFI